MTYIKSIFTILLLVLAVPVLAATDDLSFSQDTTVSDVSLGSGTTDMTVFAGSQCESFDLSGGVFTVTNPGSSFALGSSNASVKTIVVLKEGAMESCTVNSVPGSSSTTLPTASGTYTIRPLAAASCGSLCPSLTGAATYNAYPTCGAASCGSGYTLSGSGASATCVQEESGGGGSSGSFIPSQTADDQDDGVTVTQSFEETSDGTAISSEVTTTKSDSGDVEKVEVKAVMSLGGNIEDDQAVKLDSSATAEVKEVKVDIKKDAIREIIGESESRELAVNITSRKASEGQKTDSARGGKFLVGFDVFSIEITHEEKAVTGFANPLTLSFDVSAISDRSNLKVYYFNENTGKWEKAGDGGEIIGNKLVVDIDHLTDFGIVREEGENEEQDQGNDAVLSAREQQMLQIADDAGVVYLSGTDLETILIHNNTEKDTEGQTFGMANYIPELKEGISGLTLNNIYAINNFIVYGTITTRNLGAGERAGVVNSYKKAFGKLPATEAEWKDCIAIGNGRWPQETSASALARAKEEFETVYLRQANMDNPNDNAAVTVIAYGLRPDNRNMDAEAAGIRIFKDIYKYNPASALDWDIVRAISYSGATR